MENVRADVVIVGGGLAGLAAACKATELGLKPVVLEQGETPDYLCNSRVTGGVVHFASESLMEPPEMLTEKVQRITEGFTDAEITSLLAHDARRSLEWLGAQGTRFVRISPLPRHQWVLGPLRLARPALEVDGWKKRSGDALLQLLSQKITGRGGQIVLGARAEGLKVEGGRCVGVASRRNGKSAWYEGRAVMLADGGFQGNDELVKRFISPQPRKVKQRGAGTGKGDALLMAEDLGAELVGNRYFYGHLLSRDAMKDDNLWPYPGLDSLATAGIVVDGRGVRFADEGLGGVYLSNKLAWSEDPLDSWVVFDEEIWRTAGKSELFIVSANPMLANKKATMVVADALQDLEAKAGFPPGSLSRTVTGYNDALARDAAAQLEPRRTIQPLPAVAIRKPPFYAVPMCSGLTFTMGGIRVDSHMRALRPGGECIPGLFAIGKSAGGLEGGEPVGYVGGLSLAVITAIRAAEFLASPQAA